MRDSIAALLLRVPEATIDAFARCQMIVNVSMAVVHWLGGYAGRTTGGCWIRMLCNRCRNPV